MSERRKVVLVVDDQPDGIAIIEEILKRDYQVKAVTNGDAALKLARSDPPPDLILLDIMMPGMDGFEVCRNLKQDSAGAEIPVIFLTAKSMAEDEMLGLELGAADYIKKPVDPSIVRSRVAFHLASKDKALRSSELRYRRLFETAEAGMMIVDKETGAIIDANPAMASVLGLSQESFLGKRVRELEGFSSLLPSRDEAPSSAPGCSRGSPRLLERADGRRCYVEIARSSYRVEHREVEQFNVREVTELVEAERQRDELASRLSHYLSTSPTVTYSLEAGKGPARIKWISENIRGLLGYTSEEALAPDWWLRNVYAADRQGALGLAADLARRDGGYREYRFHRKDRSLAWLRDEMRFVRGGGQDSEIVGTFTDISAQKAVEAEIRLKGAALDAAANAVVITDLGGVIRWANPAFAALTGYPSAEAIGRMPKELIKSGLQDTAFYLSMWNDIRSGKVWSGKLVNKRKSGELYTEEMTITPVFDEGRAIVNYVAIKSDVTERESSRELLESSLREKETLLQEIHHRVKNNMQVMISLLSLSAQELADKDLRAKLDVITQRIHSMALIQEQFYDAADMAHIDFSGYLRRLAEILGSKFPGPEIALACEGRAAILSLEQAIPAGLVVSELLANALEHAYPDGARGWVALRQSLGPDGSLELEVSDAGLGLPPGLDPGSARTVGMILMRILAEQLEGSLSFRSEGGTTATLRFKVEGWSTAVAPSTAC
jgi:PAS domain S-box-containing protein